MEHYIPRATIYHVYKLYALLSLLTINGTFLVIIVENTLVIGAAELILILDGIQFCVGGSFVISRKFSRSFQTQEKLLRVSFCSAVPRERIQQ